MNQQGVRKGVECVPPLYLIHLVICGSPLLPPSFGCLDVLCYQRSFLLHGMAAQDPSAPGGAVWGDVKLARIEIPAGQPLDCSLQLGQWVGSCLVRMIPDDVVVTVLMATLQLTE